MSATNENNKWFNPDEYLLFEYDKTPLPTRSHVDGLDEMLSGGFAPGLWFVTAAPGTGKSAFGLYAALSASWGGSPCAFISLEMTPAQCWHRLTSAFSCTPAATKFGIEPFRWGDVPDMAEKARACMEAEHIGVLDLQARDMFVASSMVMTGHGVSDAWRFPIHITDNGRDRSLDAVTATMVEARDMGCSLVVVDYLQLIESSIGQSLYERQTGITHVLRDVANSIGIPVIVVCSMNRESLKRGKGETTMHDGSGTAAIEYDATGVIALKTIEDESTVDVRRVELKVHKNRMGRSGAALMLDYKPAYNTFTKVRRSE